MYSMTGAPRWALTLAELEADSGGGAGIQVAWGSLYVAGSED